MILAAVLAAMSVTACTQPDKRAADALKPEAVAALRRGASDQCMVEQKASKPALSDQTLRSFCNCSADAALWEFTVPELMAVTDYAAKHGRMLPSDAERLRPLVVRCAFQAFVK